MWIESKSNYWHLSKIWPWELFLKQSNSYRTYTLPYFPSLFDHSHLIWENGFFLGEYCGCSLLIFFLQLSLAFGNNPDKKLTKKVVGIHVATMIGARPSHWRNWKGSSYPTNFLCRVPFMNKHPDPTIRAPLSQTSLVNAWKIEGMEREWTQLRRLCIARPLSNHNCK
jgi:hypothetical protein